jgi:glycosyltransferase involved in cell wall biosynthesis
MRPGEIPGAQELTGDWQTSADTVVGSRVARPGPSAGWRQLKDQGTRLVLDLDDDYWNIDPLNVAAHREWGTKMLESLSANMALADVVTVVSEPLAEVARQHSDNVVVIPNALPAQLMSSVRDYRPDVLRVGWAGTASTVHDLPLAARALRKIADRGDVEVRLVGIDPRQAITAGCMHENIGTFGWIEQKDYLNVVSTFDIWVAPYRDTPFNRSKFPTKALEAGMLGIPLLASAIEPYADWIDHDRTGVLVRHEHEWTRQLKRLVDDPDLRERLGNASRGRASANILQVVNQQWQQVCTR